MPCDRWQRSNCLCGCPSSNGSIHELRISRWALHVYILGMMWNKSIHTRRFAQIVAHLHKGTQNIDDLEKSHLRERYFIMTCVAVFSIEPFLGKSCRCWGRQTDIYLGP